MTLSYGTSALVQQQQQGVSVLFTITPLTSADTAMNLSFLSLCYTHLKRLNILLHNFF